MALSGRGGRQAAGGVAHLDGEAGRLEQRGVPGERVAVARAARGSPRGSGRRAFVAVSTAAPSSAPATPLRLADPWT